MKIFIFLITIPLSFSLYATLPGKQGVASLSYAEANDHCKKLNKRLPTAREWTQYAQDHGAEGILEVAYVQNQLSGEVPEGFILIKNLSGPLSERDDFYFSNKGFKEPRDWGGGYSWWSSSFNEAKGVNYRLAFRATDDMSVWYIHNTSKAGVWCITK